MKLYSVFVLAPTLLFGLLTGSEVNPIWDGCYDALGLRPVNGVIFLKNGARFVVRTNLRSGTGDFYGPDGELLGNGAVDEKGVTVCLNNVMRDRGLLPDSAIPTRSRGGLNLKEN